MSLDVPSAPQSLCLRCRRPESPVCHDRAAVGQPEPPQRKRHRDDDPPPSILPSIIAACL